VKLASLARVKKRAAQKKSRAAKARRVPVPRTPKGPLPERRKRAAKEFVEGEKRGNKTGAMKKAGFAAATAEHHQTEVFRDPRVQAEIVNLLREKGLTDEVVIEKHRELLDAEATKWYQDQELATETDNQTQLGAVELYYKLRGLLSQKVELEIVARSWSEHVVRIIAKYVPADKRAACLNEVIRAVSEGGGTGVESAAGSRPAAG